MNLFAPIKEEVDADNRQHVNLRTESVNLDHSWIRHATKANPWRMDEWMCMPNSSPYLTHMLHYPANCPDGVRFIKKGNCVEEGRVSPHIR